MTHVAPTDADVPLIAVTPTSSRSAAGVPAVGQGPHATAVHAYLERHPLPARYALAGQLVETLADALDLAAARRDGAAIAAASRQYRQALVDLQLVPDPDRPLMPDVGGSDREEDGFRDVGSAEIPD